MEDELDYVPTKENHHSTSRSHLSSQSKKSSKRATTNQSFQSNRVKSSIPKVTKTRVDEVNKSSKYIEELKK